MDWEDEMNSLREFLRDPMGRLMVGYVVVIVFLFALIVYLEDGARDDCVSSGGSWEVDGQQTIFVKAGDSMVPVTRNTYGCKGMR
jgi:hypothetical protein